MQSGKQRCQYKKFGDLTRRRGEEGNRPQILIPSLRKASKGRETTRLAIGLPIEPERPRQEFHPPAPKLPLQRLHSSLGYGLPAHELLHFPLSKTDT